MTRLPPTMRESDIARFWAKVEKTDECWLWTAARWPKGYGAFNCDHQMWQAHRIAYYLTYGKFPTDLACHTCDNPPCVRPDHLFDGTSQQNLVDGLRKGRKVAGAHVTRVQAGLVIVALRNGASVDEAASAAKVSFDTASAISRRNSWKWLWEEYEAYGASIG